MRSSNRFRKPVTVIRNDGQYVQGRWEESATIEFSILASLQPVKQSNGGTPLSEGEIRVGAYSIFTNDELITGEDSACDIVLIAGEEYSVVKRDNWSVGVLTNNKYYAVRSSGV